MISCWKQSSRVEFLDPEGTTPLKNLLRLCPRLVHFLCKLTQHRLLKMVLLGFCIGFLPLNMVLRSNFQLIFSLTGIYQLPGS